MKCSQAKAISGLNLFGSYQTELWLFNTSVILCLPVTTVTMWRTVISTPGKAFTIQNGNEKNEVKISLTGKVTYGGRSYNAGSQLVFELKPHQKVRIQSSDMLTGTKVLSKHRVAIMIMVHRIG